jgi:choline dehydrogenase-like flavoprotein
VVVFVFLLEGDQHQESSHVSSGMAASSVIKPDMRVFLCRGAIDSPKLLMLSGASEDPHCSNPLGVAGVVIHWIGVGAVSC